MAVASIVSTLRPCSRFLLPALLMLAGLPNSAYAQAEASLSAVYHQTHLTGREHGGTYVGLAATRDLTPKWYLTGKAGYLRSVNRADLTIALEWDEWRDRHHLNTDLGIGLHLVSFRTSAVRHSLGPSLSLSYRYRQETLGYTLFYPAFFSTALEHEAQAILQYCGIDPSFHCLYFDNGDDYGIDGQYVMVSGESKSHDIGLAGALNYRLFFKQMMLSLEAGLARYHQQENKLGGTHTYFWGLSAGYRF